MRRAQVCGLAVILLCGPAHGQGSDTATGLTQSRRGSADATGTGGTGPVAHVGAGTTNGSTTGYSGEAPDRKPPGRIEVPPLPDAGLCESYKGREEHAGCLAIVLRQKGAGK